LDLARLSVPVLVALLLAIRYLISCQFASAPRLSLCPVAQLLHFYEFFGLIWICARVAMLAGMAGVV